MINNNQILALCMERQHLIKKANEAEYIELYQDMQPGLNVYWNGFGNPPSLTYRADFDDMEFNRHRQAERKLAKARLTGGNLGWIMSEDMELFACLYRKTLDKPSIRQLELLELIKQEGPLNIQQMKESTGMLVKEITPALHRLQKAFLLYEDQYDSDWDRGWYQFTEMFPDVDLKKYTHIEALKILLQRFAYRHVLFDDEMAISYYKLPGKEIRAAIEALVTEDILHSTEGGYLLSTDAELLKTYTAEPQKCVYAMHRNDFLVKSYEHILKDKYPHSCPDTLYYIMIDGRFCGAAVGKFRYTPEVWDVIVDLPKEEADAYKEDILEAIHKLCGTDNQIRKFGGEEI